MHFPFRRDRDQDVRRELESHLAEESADYQERGLSPEAAREAALRRFGNVTATEEQIHQVWLGNWPESLWQDIGFALRTLRKSPGFTYFSILALALGLGANAAIFSVVDAVLLRSLPFRDADRLVEVWEDASTIGFSTAPVAPANFVDLKRRNHVFADLAALKGDLYALTGAGNPEQIEGSPVTSNLFPLLGVSPLLGRQFSAAEDSPGGPRVALVGYGLWERRFGADRAIVGRTIQLNGEAYTVVGVLPRGITFPDKSEIWIPLALGVRQLAERNNHYLRVFGRLRPGVTLAAASREVKGLAAQLAHEYPATNENIGAVLVSLRQQLVGDSRFTLQAVAAGVGCTLLIACANLAGLLLTRGVGREREFALRSALGATRTRLIRQTLVESLLLAFAGGLAGIAVALSAIPLLRSLVPTTVSAWSEPRIDLSVLAYLCLLSLLAAVALGTLPALLFSRPNPAQSLVGGSRLTGGGGNRTRQLLIIGEVAISVVLLVGAGLLARTVWTLAHVPLGFNPQHVITLRTALPISASSPYRSFATRTAFYSRVLERVAALPGVLSAGYTTFLPLTNSGGTSPFLVEGAPPLPPGQFNDANHRVISPAYFRTLGIRLRSGRFFLESDRQDTLPVAIINATMARQYWPKESPLGHRFQLGRATGEWFTIVGVVDDIRQIGIDVAGRAEMYFPYTQPAGSYGYTTPRDLAVLVTGDPAAYVKTLESAIWQVDPSQPIADVVPLGQLISAKLVVRRIALDLIGAFAALALLLSALGLYGLLAYTVVQRRREIGVRMALGAEPFQVCATIVRTGLGLVVAGTAIGAVAASVALRTLHSLLYGVAMSDFWVWFLSAAVLLAVGCVASFLPAQRAARIDPVVALRYD